MALTLPSALYAVLYQHWAIVTVVIEDSMRVMIANRTWKDPTPGLPEANQGKLTGMVVFKTISDLVIQCVETSLHILTLRSHPPNIQPLQDRSAGVSTTQPTC